MKNTELIVTLIFTLNDVGRFTASLWQRVSLGDKQLLEDTAFQILQAMK